MSPRTGLDPPPAPVALGLIGAGRMGRVHAEILAREVPEGRLVAIADVDPAAAARLAAEVGAQPVPDHRELLFDERIEGVLIVTPTHTHPAFVADAAAAGKHVFCEKPVALSVAETRRAADIAAAAGVQLQVGLYRRFDPDYRRARERIRAGAIGRPQLIRSLQYDTFVPPLSFCDPSVSGGIAVDMGIHEFDIARWLLDDEIAEVHAVGAVHADARLESVGDVDGLLASVRFRSGVLGSVELLRDVGYAEDVRTEIVGTEGSVLVGLLPVSHSAVTSRGTLGHDLPPSAFARFRPALIGQLRAFCSAVREGREVEPSAADSEAALAAGLAARASLELGRPVSPDEVSGPEPLTQAASSLAEA